MSRKIKIGGLIFLGGLFLIFCGYSWAADQSSFPGGCEAGTHHLVAVGSPVDNGCTNPCIEGTWNSPNHEWCGTNSYRWWYNGGEFPGCTSPNCDVKKQCYQCVEGEADTDEDGYHDSEDPFPTDPNCPGEGARWVWQAKIVRLSDGCTINYYYDNQGECGDVKTATCSDFTDPSSCKEYGGSVDCRTYVGGGGPGVDWDTIKPGPGGGGTGPEEDEDAGDSTNLDLGPVVQELKKIKVDTGIVATETTSIDNRMEIISGKVTDIKDILSNLLTGQTSLGQALTDIKNAITGHSDTVVAGKIDGTNSRLDTIGGKVDAVKTSTDGVKDAVVSLQNSMGLKLDDIKNRIPEMGTDELPTPDMGAIQDNSLVDDETNADRLDAAKDTLTTFLDNLIASSPIASLVSSSGVEAAGGTSSVQVNAGSFSFVLDFSEAGDILDTLGYIFVALCTLSGVIVVLRD